jgi:hypothetical protein
MTMLSLILSFVLMSWLAAAAVADEKPEATMYRVPFCGCCDGHAEHLREHGYRVTVVETRNMTAIKKKYGVPQQFEGCHTIDIAGYVVEGHVPAAVIDRLMRERPAIRGISLPGMPDGSPGMSGTKKEPFTIYELSDETKIYATD